MPPTQTKVTGFLGATTVLLCSATWDLLVGVAGGCSPGFWLIQRRQADSFGGAAGVFI